MGNAVTPNGSGITDAERTAISALGTISSQNANAVAITGGTITNLTALSTTSASTALLGGAAASASSALAILASKTVASAADAVWNGVSLQASTLTLTGTTQCNAMVALVNIAAPTITDASAVTVDKAATLKIEGPPAAAGSVTITRSVGLSCAGDIFLPPDGANNRTIDFGTGYGTAALWLFNYGSPGTRFGWGLRVGEMQFFLSPYTDGTRHFSWNIGGDLQPSGTNELMRLTESGNLCLGTTSFGASASKCLALSNSATAPTASADLAHLYAADCNGAGTAALAIYQEDAPIAAAGVASTHKLPQVWNGTTYYVLATTVR